MSAKHIVLGATVAGLAAGLSGLPVYDESAEAPDLAYVVPVGEGVRRYKRAARSSWARYDKAVRRTYQFCSLGLVPMTMPSRIALEYMRRYSGVIGKGINTYGDYRGHPLSIGTLGVGFIMLDQAHFMEKLAASATVKRGHQLARISTTKHILSFFDQEPVQYGELVSTLPLDQVLRLAWPDAVKSHPTALPLQVLNVGLKLTDGLPYKSDIHQVLFGRGDARTILDAIDLYSHVDYEAFTPTFDKAPRIALAAKHYVGQNEVELAPEGFKARVLSDLEALGFKGHVEAAEYHYHKHVVAPVLTGDAAVEAVWALEQVGITQVGSLAQARPLRLDHDLLAGFAAGRALA